MKDTPRDGQGSSSGFGAPLSVYNTGSHDYPPPQLSMTQPPLSVPVQQEYSDPNQFLQNPVDGGPWSHSPSDPLLGGINKPPAHSPSDEPSHGTLVMSASGRSKYLGPSAASEWLKDVCQNSFFRLTTSARSARSITTTLTSDREPLWSWLSRARCRSELLSLHLGTSSPLATVSAWLLAIPGRGRHAH